MRKTRKVALFKKLASVLIVSFIFTGIMAQKESEGNNASIIDTLQDGIVFRTANIYRASSNFDYCRFAAYIPDSQKIRVVLVHQHGCGRGFQGDKTPYDMQYQAFANKWGVAIVSPSYFDKKNCFEWIDPGTGSEDAFIAGIDSLAKLSNHTELKTAPWILWGHSGGGHWVLSMINKQPERIIAAFCVSAAFDPAFNYSSLAAKIPVMLRHGGKGDYNNEGANCWQTANHHFKKLRSMNGCVSIVPTPDSDHGVGSSRYLALPFFDAILSTRFLDDNTAVHDSIANSKAWVGDTLTNMVYKLSEYKGNPLLLSWLPDSVTAYNWKEFTSTATVRPSRVLPVPGNLKARKVNGTTVDLSWNATASIESGIAYFNIYKNGLYIGRFPESGIIQPFGYGDEPIETKLPPNNFRVTGLAAHKKYAFNIAAINSIGTESVSETIIYKCN